MCSPLGFLLSPHPDSDGFQVSVALEASFQYSELLDLTVTMLQLKKQMDSHPHTHPQQACCVNTPSPPKPLPPFSIKLPLQA